jgi:type IV secretory pathway TrbD component
MPKFLKTAAASTAYLLGGAVVVVLRLGIPLWIAVPMFAVAEALFWSARKIAGDL